MDWHLRQRTLVATLCHWEDRQESEQENDFQKVVLHLGHMPQPTRFLFAVLLRMVLVIVWLTPVRWEQKVLRTMDRVPFFRLLLLLHHKLGCAIEVEHQGLE